MRVELLRFTYEIVNILLLICSVYLYFNTYALRKKLVFWFGIKSFFVLGVLTWMALRMSTEVWLTQKWMPFEWDWLMTTPITLVLLIQVVYFPQNVPIEAVRFPWIWCPLMVIAGMLADWDVLHGKWIWFLLGGFSLGVIFRALWMKMNAANHRIYRPLVFFTMGCWVLFPIVWVLGPNGIHVISIAQTYSWYTLFDVFAKSGMFLMTVWLLRGELWHDFVHGRP
jgi:bacteriorhodopsin